MNIANEDVKLAENLLQTIATTYKRSAPEALMNSIIYKRSAVIATHSGIQSVSENLLNDLISQSHGILDTQNGLISNE